MGDDHIVNPLAEKYTGGWVGDVLTASQTLGSRTGAGGAPNTRKMAVTPPSGVGSSVVGTRDDMSASATRKDVMIVLEFLSEIGLPADSIDNASWAEIRGYLRGRLNL